MNPIKRKGYTLIEILVAFAILGILIAPISSLFEMIIKTNDISKSKTEIANVMNYAFESYLKEKEKPQNEINLPKNYLGYDIEYDISNKSDYDLSGIRYDDYDAVIELNNGNATIYENNIHPIIINLSSNRFRLKAIKNSQNLSYVIYSDSGTQLYRLDVANPKQIILMKFNQSYDIIVDGIYDETGVSSDYLTVKYISNVQNINLISIYPTVYFELNPYVTTNDKQDIKLLAIKLKKNGKVIETKTFDITNRIQSE